MKRSKWWRAAFYLVRRRTQTPPEETLRDEPSEEVATASGSAVEELELEHEANASRNHRNRLAAEAAIRLAEAAIGSATSATAGSAGLHSELEDVIVDEDSLCA